MAEGDTVLMTAARTGNASVVKTLLVHGANVNAREGWKGQTALMWAAAANNASAVEALIEAGAEVEGPHQIPHAAADEHRWFGQPGGTQFRRHQAGRVHGPPFAVRGRYEAVKVLLEAGATLTTPRRMAPGCWRLAIASTHYEFADWLLQQGADPNAAGQGWTPLHQIAYTRRPNTGVNNPGLGQGKAWTA